MVDVALASCVTLPEPDLDEAPLVEALDARGIKAAAVAWDEPSIDWTQFSAVILRSTWNYWHHREAFLQWAEHVASAATLHNPPSIIRWNTHKQYLVELAALGIPTVPTALVAMGTSETLAEIGRDRGWSSVVVKPAISAGSYLTFRMDTSSEADGSKFNSLASERDLLVQPFIDSVGDYGERSIILIDGEITHAIRKTARFGGDDEAIRGPMAITDSERALAKLAIESIPVADGPLLYSRVDMAPDADGKPLLMELELTEPSLFFQQGPRALERLSDAIAALVSKNG